MLAGLELSRVKSIVWYSTAARLRKEVEKLKSVQKQRVWIFCQGISKTTGLIPELPEILKIKEEISRNLPQKVHLIVDESLSFGALGEDGRGVLSHFSIPCNKVDFVVGSLEYAYGGVGGFLVGTQSFCDFQTICASSYTFSAAGPAYVMAHCLAVCSGNMGQPAELLQSVPEFAGFVADLQERRSKLTSNIQYFEALWAEKLPETPLISSPESFLKVVPSAVSSSLWITKMPAARMAIVKPPHNPNKMAIFTIMSYHSPKDIQKAIQVFCDGSSQI